MNNELETARAKYEAIELQQVQAELKYDAASDAVTKAAAEIANQAAHGAWGHVHNSALEIKRHAAAATHFGALLERLDVELDDAATDLMSAQIRAEQAAEEAAAALLKDHRFNTNRAELVEAANSPARLAYGAGCTELLELAATTDQLMNTDFRVELSKDAGNALLNYRNHYND